MTKMFFSLSDTGDSGDTKRNASTPIRSRWSRASDDLLVTSPTTELQEICGS